MNGTNFFIVPTAEAKTLNYELLCNHSANGLMIDNDALAAQELPSYFWDAAVEIEGNDLIISGHAGPSGWGSATMRFPFIDSAERGNLDECFYLEPNDETDSLALQNHVQRMGWKVVKN